MPDINNTLTGLITEVKHVYSDAVAITLTFTVEIEKKIYLAQVRTSKSDPRLQIIFGSRAVFDDFINATDYVYKIANSQIVIDFSFDPKNTVIQPNSPTYITVTKWQVSQGLFGSPKESTPKTENLTELVEPGFRPLRVPFDPYIVDGDKVLDRTKTRIGYAVFDNPINYLSYTRNSQIDQVPMLRDSGTIKKGTGKAYESYSISYMANGPEEIRKSVADVFEQIGLQPFLTVEGGPFGTGWDDGDIPHRAIAVRNFSVATVEGLPNTLQVSINFDPFNWEWYVPPADEASVDYKASFTSVARKDLGNARCQMDDFICWPLMKIWGKTRQRSRFEDKKFDGVLEFAFPDDRTGKLIDELLTLRRDANPALEDLNALNTLRFGLLNQDSTRLTSRNAKEIILTGNAARGTRVFLLKLDQANIAKAMFGLTTQATGTAKFDANMSSFEGLVEWSKLASYNFIDDQGNFLSQSGYLDVKYVTKTFGVGRPATQIPILSDLPILDITKEDISDAGGSLAEAIARQTRVKYLGEEFRVTPPPPSDPQYNYYISTVLPELQARQNEPQIYYGFFIVTQQGSVGTQKLKQVTDQAITQAENLIQGADGVLYQDVTRLLADNFNPDAEYLTTFNTQKAKERDVVIESIAGSRGHSLALLNTMAFPTPIHQYMGGMDATFIIQGKAFGREARKMLENLKEEFDARALNKTSRRYVTSGKESQKQHMMNGAFLRVRNEIFQLLGVDFVMPLTLSFDSVDQQPDVWNFTLTFIEFDPKQKYAEEMKYLSTSVAALGQLYNYGNQYRDGNYGDFDPIVEKAREWFSLQASLAKEEVYLDMSLPTKGELDLWISAIKKAAELYSPKNTNGLNIIPAVGTVAGSVASNFTAYDQQIVKYVAEYIPLYYKDIKNNWPWVNVKETTKIAESSAFTDPDFYCYYIKHATWKDNFDTVGNFMFGKVADDFEAIPNDIEHQKMVPGYREFDPKHGLYTGMGPDYWNRGAKHTQSTLETLFNNQGPKERATKLKKGYDDGTQALINESGDRWWVKQLNLTSVELVGDELIVGQALEDLLLQGPIVDEDAGYSYEKDPDMAQRIGDYFGSGNNTPTAEDISNMSNDLAAYFSIAWRQQTTRKSSNWAPRGPQSVFQTGVSTKGFLLADNTILWRSSEDITLDKLLTAAEWHSTRAYGALPPNWMDSTTKYVAQKIDPNSFIIRTAKINANYTWFKDVSTKAIKTFVQGSSPADNVEKNWDLVDKIALKYTDSTTYIDPHIIRTIFFLRDGFQYFDPKASQEQGGGDFDENTVGKGAQAIDAFTRVYAKFLKEYKIPSLALIAAHLQLTIKGRQRWWDTTNQKLKPEAAIILASAAQEAERTGGAFTREARAAIQTAIARLPEGGIFIDEYFAGYIHMCRVYGSYWNNNKNSDFDPFFYPLSGLIMIGDDGKYLNTNFTPSGRSKLIHAARVTLEPKLPELVKYGDTNPAPGGGEPFDMNKSSLELQMQQAQKLKMAIEPESEAAIYGSLVAMREHAPFGKLLGAYPAYKVIITNEGFYWAQGSTKLWDNFYTRTGVGSIEIFKSKHFPGGTCDIIFSNMFHNLTAYAQMEAFEHQMAVETSKRIFKKEFGKPGDNPVLAFATFPFRAVGELWNDLVIKKVPDQVIRLWQNNHLKQVVLSAGARIQVRMGYGSNVAKLPVVFNGQVVDVPVGEGFIKVTAVGDGAELEKPSTQKLVKSGNSFAYATGAAFGAGRDPSVIVTESLIAPGIMANVSQGLFRDFSHGIAHFGDIKFVGFLHSAAELQINIYSSSPTKIEQGIPSFDFFNFIMGLTAWNTEKNLFSVEVNEPTPWKVIEVCRRATLDFVASAEPFCNRSTLFFGKPWYPFHYTYKSSILDVGVSNYFQGTPNVGATAEQLGKQQGTQPVKPTVTEATVKQVEKYGDIIDPARITALEESVKAYFKKEIKSLKAITIRAQSRVNYANYRSESWVIVFIDDSVSYITNDPYIEHTQEKFIMGNWGVFTTPNDTYWIMTEAQAKGVATLDKDYNAHIEAQQNYSSVNILNDVTTLTQHLKWRNYTQVYVAHSMLNLLANDIRADSTNVYTDAVGQYSYNGFGTKDSALRTITMAVDSDIAASDRKTMLVETGIAVTGTQAGWGGLAQSIAKAGSFLPVLGSLTEYISATPTTPAVHNGVVMALCDQVKEMYQGWFTIVGESTIKPRDMMNLNDHINDLRGPCTVKEVIHKMDADFGFVTMVSPDAIVFPSHSYIGQKWYTSLYCFSDRVTAFYINKAVKASLMALLKSGAFRGDRALVEGASRAKQFIAKAKQQGDLRNKIDNLYAQLREEVVAQQKDILAKFKDKTKSVLVDGKFVDVSYQDILDDVAQFPDEKIKIEAELKALEKSQVEDLARWEAKTGKFTYEDITRLANKYNLKIPKEYTIDLTYLRALDLDAELVRKKEEFILARTKGRASPLNALGAQAEAAFERQEIVEALNQFDKTNTNQIAAAFGNYGNVEDFEEELAEIIKLKTTTKGLNSTESKRLRELEDKLSVFLTDESLLGEDLRIIFKEDAAFKDVIDASTGKISNPIEKLRARVRLRRAMAQNIDNIEDISKKPTDVVKSAISAAERARDEVKAARAALKEGASITDVLKKYKAPAQVLAKDALAFGKEGILAFRLAKYAGPQAIVSLAIDVAWFTIGNSLLQGFNARLAARQSVKIIPLRAGRLPYTAGIKGHQGAVIGDQPGFYDNLITQALDPSVNSNCISWLATFQGVDVPKYGINDVDQQWIEKYQNYIQKEDNGDVH